MGINGRIHCKEKTPTDMMLPNQRALASEHTAPSLSQQPLLHDRAWVAAVGLAMLLTSCQISSPKLDIDSGVSVVDRQRSNDNSSTLLEKADETTTLYHSSQNKWQAQELDAVANKQSAANDALMASIFPLYKQASALVEQELDVDLSHIQLLLVEDSPINAEVARETRRLVTEQFGDTAFADLFLDKVMHTQSGTYAALFTSRLQAIMVSRNMLSSYEQSLSPDEGEREAALLTLLIHELVHAADDLRYHIHENRALNFRASFAQSATFEGHAQWVTRRICEQNGCLNGLNSLDSFMFSRNASQSKQLTQPVEAISRNVLEYSYIEGERFIATLAGRENGAQLIDDLLQSPPFDPIQILAPESYPDVARERRNQRLIRASREIDHPWVRSQWVSVETSPLKGVDLRSDPSRRQAAIDGFTRLIEGMVAVQLYDRTRPHNSPMDVTLLHAESAHTASLFARTLHENTLSFDTASNEEPLNINTGAGTSQSQMNMHMYRSSLDGSATYRTSVAVSGPYVVQVAGTIEDANTLDDFAIRVLLNLQLEHDL